MSPSLRRLALLPMLFLVACQSGRDDEEEAAAFVMAREAAAAPAATAAVPAGASAGVVGFTLVISNRPVLSTYKVTSAGWAVEFVGGGLGDRLTEISRSACCIQFTRSDGQSISADFETMQASTPEGFTGIADVVRE